MARELIERIDAEIHNKARELAQLQHSVAALEDQLTRLRAARAALLSDADASAGSDAGGIEAPRQHAGKYKALWKYLRDHRENQIRMSFKEVERVLGFPLPHSSRRHLPHWYGYEGSAVARAIRDAGWKATRVDLEAETVVFVRQHKRAA